MAMVVGTEMNRRASSTVALRQDAMASPTFPTTRIRTRTRRTALPEPGRRGGEGSDVVPSPRLGTAGTPGPAVRGPPPLRVLSVCCAVACCARHEFLEHIM